MAASLAAVTLAQVNLPTKIFWDARPILLYMSIGLMAYITVHEGVRLALPSLQAARVRDYERNVRASLSAGLQEVVAKFPTAKWNEVGVHAFMARGVRPMSRLVNVGGIRISGQPSMVKPLWRPGKGVVGRAWAEHRFHAVDWELYFRTANNSGPSVWRSRKSEDRYCLSWGELQLTAEYKRISAYPIHDPSGTQIGCIAVDAPISQADMESPAMEQILRQIALAVANAGTPPKAWWSYRRL